MVRVPARTTYLEMTDPAALRPARRPPRLSVEIKQAEIPSPELNRFLYTAVGGDWHWLNKLTWTYERWLEFISRPGFQTWVVYVSWTPEGYFELFRDDCGDVEIVSFGLLPKFIGRGLGGYALTEAIRRAWAMKSRRVWLHTWTLDHPYALTNYLARGLTIFKEESFTIEAPKTPPGPWPGARAKRPRREYDFKFE